MEFITALGFVAYIAIVFLIVLAVMAVLWQLVIRPWLLVAFVVVTLLAISCSRPAAAAELRFEVSVIIESDADRAAADDAVRYAANIYRSQLGIDLAVTYIEVGTVANHTQAQFLLDALEDYRLARASHRAADATVLFTRRTLTVGSIEQGGLATTGPACSAAASALVELRNDNYDGQILAHELLHTLGIAHDHETGWLMSVHLARAGSDVINPDDVLTVKAAPLDCMVSVLTPQAVPSSVGSPPAVTGGGGSFDWATVVAFGLIGWLMILQRQTIGKLQDKTIADATRIAELENRLPDDVDLCDVVAVWQRSDEDHERLMMVKFNTLASMTDLHRWLHRQMQDARTREAMRLQLERMRNA